jgi:hypothetical protein
VAPETQLGDETLGNVRVGFSVSESRELGRLGLREAHLRLALGELGRVVIRAGGSVVYGGHLQETGYTAFLASELDRYGRADQPLRLVLGWPEHHKLALSELKRHQRALGLKGSFTYLDREGNETDPMDGRGEEPAPVDTAEVAESLSALRTFLASVTDARILLGGKESGFEGRMPGIVEEAQLAIAARQPLFLIGGFGGATASIAQIACQQPERWPPRDPAHDDVDPRATHALAEVRAVIDSSGWSITANGLNIEDNLRLSTSHRPSEIATLVAIGLSRTFGGA